MNADFDLDAPELRQLIGTIDFLCERGSFGYAGLDEHYCGIWRYGALASWIPIGANVCRNTDLFFGLEKELLDLQDAHGTCVTLPRVGVPSSDDPASKMSIEIYWDDLAGVYHVIVHRLIAESEVELELLKQIRARRLAEENFQSTRERLVQRQMLLDILMEQMPVATAVFDEQARYLFATRRWARTFGLECEPLIGQDCFAAGTAMPDHARFDFKARLMGLTGPPQIEAMHRDEADTRSHRWTHQSWMQPDGARGGVVSSAEDVSDLVTGQARLSLENEELKATNRQLAEFAAVVGHDLNAPLRSLQAVIDEIEEGMPGAPVDRLRAHVDRMRSILEGTRDYTRALSSEIVIKAVDIATIVSGIINTLPNGKRFSIEFDLATPCIFVNANLLDVVLRNLLDNSIKHHDLDHGRLTISVSDEENDWLIGVEDDGPGIPVERQAELIGGRSRARPGSGSGGMGLAIATRVLDGIGASMTVASDPASGRGSKFVIRWPKNAVSFASATDQT